MMCDADKFFIDCITFLQLCYALLELERLNTVSRFDTTEKVEALFATKESLELDNAFR